MIFPKKSALFRGEFLTAMALLWGSAAALWAQSSITLQNNSFEALSVVAGNYSAGLASLSGWAIAGGNLKISVINPDSSGSTTGGSVGRILLESSLPDIQGENLLGLTNNGTVGKSVSQTVTGFVPGQPYTFSAYFGSQYNQAAQFIASDSIVVSLSSSLGTLTRTVPIPSIPGVVAVPDSVRTNDPVAYPNDFQGALRRITLEFSASELAGIAPDATTPVKLTIQNNSGSNSNTSLLIDNVKIFSGEEVEEQPVYPGGRVGRWTFDEAARTTVRDYTPNKYDGVVQGDPVWTTSGRFHGALLLDGVSSEVRFGTGPSLLGSTPFVVSAWVQTTAQLSQVVIQQSDTTAASGEYQVSLTSTGHVRFKLTGAGGTQFDFTSTHSVNDGTWHQIAVKRDGADGFIFIDGALAAQSQGAVQKLATSNSVNVGADTRYGNAHFKGAIDDLRIWNRSLSPAEILGLYREVPAVVPQIRPNVVIIYTDDLGYGDVGFNGATKVKTPNIDQLAATGLRFTDGHAPASTCTPSRYALLTGQYAWRKGGTDILTGDAPLTIDPKALTLPALMKQAGYTTSLIGKWHLGLGTGRPDWNGILAPGPYELGFDYSFFFPATADRVPTVYVENRNVVNLDPADPIQVSYSGKVGDWPTYTEHPELATVMKSSSGHNNTITSGIGRIGWMTGGTAALWKDEDLAPTFTAKAVQYIEDNKDRPFFLYLAIHDIHVPRVPAPQFVGTSECGTRGDAIQELDWVVGQVTSKLQALGLAQNTIVIFSSDNGPVLNDGYVDGAVTDLNGHDPAGGLRGGKYDLYEAGTRVPLIVNWPEHITPGSSNALVSHVDFLSSFASLFGIELPVTSAPDSFDLLDAFLGQSPVGRSTFVEQSSGQNIAIRSGNWKLLPGTNPVLYDLNTDTAETSNVAAQNPAVVAQILAELNNIKTNSASRPVSEVIDPPAVPAASGWAYLSLGAILLIGVIRLATLRRQS